MQKQMLLTMLKQMLQMLQKHLYVTLVEKQPAGVYSISHLSCQETNYNNLSNILVKIPNSKFSYYLQTINLWIDPLTVEFLMTLAKHCFVICS